MSFLSVLKSIGHVIATGVSVATPFEPLIGAIPVAGPIATTVLNSIMAAEQLIPASGTGTNKKAVVTQIVNTVHPGVDPAALSSGIDAVVSALNALQAALAKMPTTTSQ